MSGDVYLILSITCYMSYAIGLWICVTWAEPGKVFYHGEVPLILSITCYMCYAIG